MFQILANRASILVTFFIRMMTALILCLFLTLPSYSQTPEPPAVVVEEVEPRICHEGAPPFPLQNFASEQYIYQELCDGWDGYIDLSWQDQRDLPCNPSLIEGPVPEHRKISGAFLAWLFTDPGISRSLYRPRISIGCAQIISDVDLSYQHVAPVFWIWNSHFLGELDFLQARFERTINLYKSVVEGELNGDAMDVGKSLFLHGGAAFRKDVILRGAAVTGTISAIGSTFEGKFNGNRMDVGKSLFLRGGATFKKKVNLLNANIRGSVATKGSTFEGEFNGNAMDVGKSLFLRGGATFKKKVNLLNANIEGSVETRGSTFHGEFVGDSIKVGGYLLLSDGATFKQKVDLLNATIRGNVETDGSTFKGEFNGDSMDVGKSLYLGGGATFNQKVNLLNATVEGNVQTKDSTFEGEFNGDGLVVGGSLFLRGDATFKDRVILIVAQVGSHLQFGQSTFLDQVNMTGARIGDELLISSPAENHGVPSWGPEASLVLRNVETKALQAEMRAWRTVDGGWLPTELKGFAYQRLGGLYADMDGGGVNMAAAPVADLVNWMEQSQPNHDARYTPQPYSQLAEALGRNGSIMKSKKVILERGKHQRRAEDTPMFNKIGLVLVQGLVGFGAYPFRVLYWFAALVIVGVWVASRGTSPELHRFGQWFWYSLENALPLVPLKGTFRDIEHDNGYVDGFFHAQRVLGFILATVLVGALAFLGR